MGSLGNLSTTNLSVQSRGPVTDDRKDALKVDPYDGKRSQLNAFLIQLKLVFKLNPGRFEDGPSKVMYAAMHLRGAAFAWFEPTMKNYVDDDTPDGDTTSCFAHFAEFENRIRKVFGTINDERMAARVIYTIKQRGSAAAYYSEFNQVARKLNWEDDDAFAQIFYNGLKESVRREMMDPPTDYRDMVDEAIKIDNRLYELKLERDGRRDPNEYVRRGYQFSERQSYGDRMDLDLMHRDRPSRPRGNRARGRGGYHGQGRGNARRAQRGKEGLCYTCGKPGHRAKDCQLTTQGLHMMSDGITGSEETKADTSEKTQMTTDSQGMEAQQGHLGQEVQKELGEPQEDHSKEVAPGETMTALMKACEQAITDQHAALSWTACYDNSCLTHYSDKMGSGWFPQPPRKRKNRRSRKTKEIQEALAQEGDMRNAEEKRDDSSFWMMNEGSGDPVKFITISTTRKEIIIVTPYWERLYCQEPECLQGETTGHQHAVFRPNADPTTPVFITIEFCQRTGCEESRLHAHEAGRRTFVDLPQEVLDQVWGVETQTLGMMSQRVQLTGLPLGQEDDKKERRYVITDQTDRGLRIITNAWNSGELCQTGCEEGQHTHVAFDERAPVRDTLKRIDLRYCFGEECEDYGQIHIHQHIEPTTVVINLRPEQEKRLWDAQYSRQDRGGYLAGELPIAGVITDNRARKAYLAKGFPCDDQECPGRLASNHRHFYNVDPARDNERIHPEAFEWMIEEGHECRNQECAMRRYPHVHQRIENCSMMIGDKYSPEMLDEVIDHRVYHGFIAEYFPCSHPASCDCPEPGHRHLYHVDPDFPMTKIHPEAFEVLEECFDTDCQWDNWRHVHWALPKNEDETA
jgi:hypothetical protein